MQIPRITLTRAKLIELGNHVLITALLFMGMVCPPLPVWAKGAVVAMAMLAVLSTVVITFWPREKEDERAARNAARADAVTLELLYTGVGLALFVTLFQSDFSLTFNQILLGFSAVGLLRSLFFLLFERFGG